MRVKNGTLIVETMGEPGTWRFASRKISRTAGGAQGGFEGARLGMVGCWGHGPGAGHEGHGQEQRVGEQRGMGREGRGSGERAAGADRKRFSPGSSSGTHPHGTFLEVTALKMQGNNFADFFSGE